MNKKTIFITSGIVALLVLAMIGFFYYRENIFSKQVLKLEILGSENVKMGSEVEYRVKYKNNSNFALEQPRLVFELPDNSLTEDSKTRITQDLEDIYQGDEKFVIIKARLLGKEGDLKVVRAVLTYVPHNLSVRYESDTTFTTKIETVPITLTLDLPSKVERGKELNYVINYFSNVDYPLENMSIKVDSISGFNFVSAIPSSLDDAEWKLPVLEKGDGGRVTIKGNVSGDIETNMNFSAHLGMWVDGIFIAVRDAEQEVEVIQPQLFISQQVNGSSQYVASPGEALQYKIFIRNIGSTSFKNVFVSSRLDGSLFDTSTLQSSLGEVRQNGSLIAFDPKQIIDLQVLRPQQEVSLSFAIKLKDAWNFADTQSNSAVVKNIINASGIEQEFSTKVNARIQVFQTKGSPVKSETSKETSYPITWQVKNYLNNIKNVKVRAILPLGVTLNDVISPDSEASHFSFDNSSREIVWTVGDIMANGTSLPLVFEVSSLGGGLLVGQVTVSGDDEFTGATVQSTASALGAN